MLFQVLYPYEKISMNEDFEYTSCKIKFSNMLSYCEKIKLNDSEDYSINIPIPILDDEGFVKMKFEKKTNFKKFLSNNNTEITNSKPFEEIKLFFSESQIFRKYLFDKKIIETEKVLITEISDILNEFTRNLIINYLQYTESLKYSEEIFSNIWIILKNFLTNDHRYHYYFIPLHGLKGSFSKILLNDDLEIGLLSADHYSRVSDLDIMTNIDKPDKRYWNLRYGIYVKLKEELNLTPSSRDIYKNIKQILDSLRLFKRGNIYLGAIYPVFDKIWKTETFPPRIGSENPPDITTLYYLDSNEIDDYTKLFKKISSINLENDSRRYISSGIRRFNASYTDIFLEDKITNLTMVLEYLLTTGPGEIQTKLSLRGALLLGKNEDEREYLWKVIKKCYIVRSEIVHGKQRKKIQIDDKQYTDDELLIELERISRQTLISIFCLQHVYPLQKQLINRLDDSIVNRNKVIEIAE